MKTREGLVPRLQNTETYKTVAGVAAGSALLFFGLTGLPANAQDQGMPINTDQAVVTGIDQINISPVCDGDPTEIDLAFTKDGMLTVGEGVQAYELEKTDDDCYEAVQLDTRPGDVLETFSSGMVAISDIKGDSKAGTATYQSPSGHETELELGEDGTTNIVGIDGTEYVRYEAGKYTTDNTDNNVLISTTTDNSVRCETSGGDQGSLFDKPTGVDEQQLAGIVVAGQNTSCATIDVAEESSVFAPKGSLKLEEITIDNGPVPMPPDEGGEIGPGVEWEEPDRPDQGKKIYFPTVRNGEPIVGTGERMETYQITDDQTGAVIEFELPSAQQ